MEHEPLLKGQVDMLLLSIVARGPVHGYALIDQLRLRSGGSFDLPEGTIYPALYRLERMGLLKSEAKKISGRTRRIYRITKAGAEALTQREATWRQLVRDIEAVMGGDPLADHGPAD